MRLSAALAVTALALVTVGGCSTESGEAGESGGAPAEVAGESTLLAEHGLQGLSAREIVDTLDASTTPRPLAIGASVNPTELTLSDGAQELVLDLPEDQFYLSVAPFLNSTHECYFHSLGSCQGELTQEPMQVRITDAQGTVLVDEQVTTGTNGFAGFWLPRDITGTIEVEHEGHTGSVDFATDAQSPTCLTTLQLAA